MSVVFLHFITCRTGDRSVADRAGKQQLSPTRSINSKHIPDTPRHIRRHISGYATGSVSVVFGTL